LPAEQLPNTVSFYAYPRHICARIEESFKASRMSFSDLTKHNHTPQDDA